MATMAKEGLSMTEKIKTIPDGYTSVTPWIIVKGAAQFLDFIKNVFGGEEMASIYNQDGTIGHAEARIGDAVVMMFDSREDWPVTPQFLRLYVNDARAVYEAALAAGSRSVTNVTELGFGDQVGRLADPWGNIWWIQERLEELSFEEMGKRMAEPRYAEAMEYVQKSLDEEMRRRGAERV